MSENEENYEVGYGNPPKHTQFQPGQSGNPKGRKKKTKDLAKLVDRELSQLIRVKENGKSRTLTIREAIIKAVAVAAVQGDNRAQRIILPFMDKQPDLDGFEVDPAAESMLQDLFDQQTSTEKGENGSQD